MLPILQPLDCLAATRKELAVEPKGGLAIKSTSCSNLIPFGLHKFLLEN